MSKSATKEMNQVKRFSQFLDLAEFPEFISENDNRRFTRIAQM
jgi:hypothetical protein